MDDLRGMPLNKLRHLDIRTIDQEKMVQRAIDEKMIASPVIGKPLVFSNAITDKIRTPEQEHELQLQIDAHNESLRQQLLKDEAQEDELDPLMPIISDEPAVVEAPTIEDDKAVEVVKGFCDSCDSKGVRHKKVCPKYVAL